MLRRRLFALRCWYWKSKQCCYFQSTASLRDSNKTVALQHWSHFKMTTSTAVSTPAADLDLSANIMYLFHHQNDSKNGKQTSIDVSSLQYATAIVPLRWEQLWASQSQPQPQPQPPQKSSAIEANDHSMNNNNDDNHGNDTVDDTNTATATATTGDTSTDTANTKRLKWDNKYFSSKLSTHWMSQTFLFCDDITSTQAFLKTNAEILPAGTVCACNTQSVGRGRGQNTWDSPKGCLMFSFTCDLSAAKVRYLPSIQYIISIAIVQSILHLTTTNNTGAGAGTGIQLQLKWPNDIYHNGLKLGGILCESIYLQSSNEYRVIAGIGLNVDNDKPTTSINQIILEHNRHNHNGHNGNNDKNDSNHNVQCARIKREDVLSTFCNIFEPMFNEFVQRGFAPLRKQYLEYWLHTGQTVQVVDGDGDGDGDADDSSHRDGKKRVTITGITNDGLLIAHDSDGQVFELHPNGNSLDFFQGLISKKQQI